MNTSAAGRLHPETAPRGKEEPTMDLNHMLEQLREQRIKLERLIMAAEDYAATGARRRGRPPAWMTNAKHRGRPPGSKNKAPTPITKAG